MQKRGIKGTKELEISGMKQNSIRLAWWQQCDSNYTLYLFCIAVANTGAKAADLKSKRQVVYIAVNGSC